MRRSVVIQTINGARARRGSGVFAAARLQGVRGFDLKRVTREAQYPSRTITIKDQDGNVLRISF